MPTQSTDAWFQRNWTSETDSFSGGDRHQITLWSGRVPCDSNPPNGHNTKRLEQSNQSATEPPLVTPEIPYIYIQGIAWGPASRRIDQNIKRAQARVVRSTSTSWLLALSLAAQKKRFASGCSPSERGARVAPHNFSTSSHSLALSRPSWSYFEHFRGDGNYFYGVAAAEACCYAF